jgi:hypothetical protein
MILGMPFFNATVDRRDVLELNGCIVFQKEVEILIKSAAEEKSQIHRRGCADGLSIAFPTPFAAP